MITGQKPGAIDGYIYVPKEIILMAPYPRVFHGQRQGWLEKGPKLDGTSVQVGPALVEGSLVCARPQHREEPLHGMPRRLSNGNPELGV